MVYYGCYSLLLIVLGRGSFCCYLIICCFAFAVSVCLGFDCLRFAYVVGCFCKFFVFGVCVTFGWRVVTFVLVNYWWALFRFLFVVVVVVCYGWDVVCRCCYFGLVARVCCVRWCLGCCFVVSCLFCVIYLV